MASSSPSSPSSSPSYGLTYQQHELDSLPKVTTPSDSLHQSAIHRLSPAEFSKLHLRQLVVHPPDSVLFPFLHGIEGCKNMAQTTFFVSGPQSRVQIPNYRGLIWVVAEDDLDNRLKGSFSVASHNSLDEDNDSYEDDDLEDSISEDDQSSISPHSPIDGFPMDVDDAQMHDAFQHQQAHMHPVAHRGGPFPIDLSQFKDPIKNSDDTVSHERRVSSLSSLSADTAESASLYSDLSLSTPSSSILPASAPPSEPSPSPKPLSSSAEMLRPPVMTSTFRPSELIRPCEDGSGDWEFIPPNVPDGISLRNFGIQVPIYATLSDIVVYSPKGLTSNCIVLAERFRSAISRKRQERLSRISNSGVPGGTAIFPPKTTASTEGLIQYNVFTLDAVENDMRRELPHLMVSMSSAEGAHTDRHDGGVLEDETPSVQERQVPMLIGANMPNTIDFARREKQEMRELTRASEIISLHPQDMPDLDLGDPRVGQVFLGNTDDVPLYPEAAICPLPISFPPPDDVNSPFNSSTNLSGYDICVECHDQAPFPTVSQLRLADEHLSTMERKWVEYCHATKQDVTPRPPPNAGSIIHLPFPSSPIANASTMALLLPMLKFLEKWITPVPSVNDMSPTESKREGSPAPHSTSNGRRWSTVSSMFPSFSTPSQHIITPFPSPRSSSPYRTRSQTLATPPPPHTSLTRTRPLKILLYSADGYTESSVPALCLLMTVRGLKLAEAYLELQVEKKRSFFVYGSDLPLLKRVEGKLCKPPPVDTVDSSGRRLPSSTYNGTITNDFSTATGSSPTSRPSAKSVSLAKAPTLVRIPSTSPPPSTDSFLASSSVPAPSHMDAPLLKGRPRANTSPWLPSFGNHLSWFNDSRFDGSFPSRVLPFLYLGNLNHAMNAYMLHALGITHVVSVGECALVPPPQAHQACYNVTTSNGGGHQTHSQFINGKEGSLWIEEREGRIKVLDIKGVCDDGIDTLEPQLEPICDWIDRAREEGGKVLVHCRVGVSRSATVTIAYVMKHLNVPLSDAYLIVRSRRLSVLIQPNMRLLYNLLGWEIKLAKQRVGDDENLLRVELSRALSWPYIAKEIHALNEKYLQ